MTDKNKRQQVIKIIKDTLNSGNYDYTTFRSIFPPYLKENVDNITDYRAYIIKLVAALGINHKLNEAGLYDFVKYDWNKIDKVDADLFKWR